MSNLSTELALIRSRHLGVPRQRTPHPVAVQGQAPAQPVAARGPTIPIVPADMFVKHDLSTAVEDAVAVGRHVTSRVRSFQTLGPDGSVTVAQEVYTWIDNGGGSPSVSMDETKRQLLQVAQQMRRG